MKKRGHDKGRPAQDGHYTLGNWPEDFALLGKRGG